ncbi:hypothetical protein [Streptomyces sp. TLI_053]|uniref:hypothetical protein n=1 Tax=Streptomyces sp. TLI_053 TaxID=1855352 RepID=UPI000A9F708D|nr:hypothetical protein [Streptomyces sp. TLI_053]
MADTIAQQKQEFQGGSEERWVGQAPMPPIDNRELGTDPVERAGCAGETGGDLYAVIMNVAVNSWLAGHIHGEEGCSGCDGSRGPFGHDWPARMNALAEHAPDITKWFDRDVWTAALNDSGFSVVRR